LSEIIPHYFPELSSTQLKQYADLESLYQYWNARINVISRKDIDSLYVHHVLHSLGIAKVQPFEDGASILDIGTGGGFPGIPLAILFPNVNFLLVDAIGKKIKVVEEVASALQLKNIETKHARAEELTGKFDFIVSRAVTKLDRFAEWTQKKISSKQQHKLPNGILYLKGGDLKEELSNFKEATCFELSNYFKESFFETKKVVHLPVFQSRIDKRKVYSNKS
jgi:16S rRNA (guanine527-N7)-methyltransferase